MNNIKGELEYLEGMLNSITIPYTTITSSRRGFPKHRRATFGIVRQRATAKYSLSVFSKKHSIIYNEILRIGKLISPPDFTFTTIHLNKNVICPPHKDEKNVGDSIIISFGDYSGCNLVIDGKIVDAKYNPIRFNGAELEHYNTDDLIGTKYSLIFYSVSEGNKK